MSEAKGQHARLANGASAAATLLAGVSERITRALFMRFNSFKKPALRLDYGM